MPRQTTLPSRRFHSLIYLEDLEFLETEFGPDSNKPIGVGYAIREIIHKRVLYLRDIMQREIDKGQDQGQGAER